MPAPRLRHACATPSQQLPTARAMPTPRPRQCPVAPCAILSDIPRPWQIHTGCGPALARGGHTARVQRNLARGAVYAADRVPGAPVAAAPAIVPARPVRRKRQ
eukprot:gene14272-biopygen12625